MAKKELAEAWWNTKRFKSEREALLHRSEKCDPLYEEANAAYIAADKEKFEQKVWDRVIQLYTKAAKAALDDDDHVTYAILDSTIPSIQASMERHRTEYPEGKLHIVVKDDDEPIAGGSDEFFQDEVHLDSNSKNDDKEDTTRDSKAQEVAPEVKPRKERSAPQAPKQDAKPALTDAERLAAFKAKFARDGRAGDAAGTRRAGKDG